MAKLKQTWYREWFDSSYYDLLYQHRDEQEAKSFINNLFEYLNLRADTNVLDLACGKGRHSIQVHGLGYRVTGLDLSKESIKYAMQFKEERLDFRYGDMRELPYSNEFDLVLNLFTSFGYFEEDLENLKVIQSISKALKQSGILVLDFLNVKKVVQNLPNEELIKRGNVSFKIKKYLENGAIIKDICYQHEGEEKKFLELVKSIDLAQFESYFEHVGMRLKAIFGDYQLSSFNENSSDRLIMIVEKPAL